MRRRPLWPSDERRPTPKVQPAIVTLWDREQRRYTVVSSDSHGLELVGPANTVTLGQDLTLGIGFSGGDVFVTVRVLAVAPGRTNPQLARIRATWQGLGGTDAVLTRRFMTERLGVSETVVSRWLTVSPHGGQPQRRSPTTARLGYRKPLVPMRPRKTLENPHMRDP